MEEKENKELEKKFYKVDFSKLAKYIFSDLEETKANSILFGSFTKERVMSAIQNPQKNEDVLRNLSNFLYIASPHYKRLCSYYAEMPSLSWVMTPIKLDIAKVNVDRFKKIYSSTLSELDNMDIKHEFFKILQVVYREGIFYGYEYKTEDSYFIQKLDADNCRISGFEDGVFIFEFNFDYFSGNEDKLENYAPEFTTKYNNYKNSKKQRGKDKVDLTWQQLESENSICIKTDETVFYPFPPFIGVLPDIYEIQDYKSLKKANNEMQNIALVSGTIPMNSKSDAANDFKVTLDTAIEFGNKIATELPDQVGFMLSVFEDMKLFKLSDDKVGTDKVEEATKNFWSATGVSKNLFADDSNTDAAIKYSTTADEQSSFGMLRQIERWINRKLKLKKDRYKFKIEMLNITNFNENEVISRELKSAQYGFPNKIRTFVSMGGKQSEIESMAFLENDILGLSENFIPLSSSHTQGGDVNSPTSGEKGRPSEEEDKVRTDGEGDD